MRGFSRVDGDAVVLYLAFRMSRARTTGLSAGEAVLGLVIEQPDRGFGLERRLEERFGAARFAYSTAYNALYRMERQGLVRVAGTATGDAREATYEATPRGVEHFRQWLRAPATAPVLREELHAKIAFCEPRDLPRLIDVVHDEELACIRELDSIRERMLTEREGDSDRSLAEQDWSALMARGVVDGEAAFWGGRIAQLARLRTYLQELREEAGRRTLHEDRRELRQRRAG
jgi:DNA-binding PadR family transcriptional regulator